jgi:hypothetical protein
LGGLTEETYQASHLAPKPGIQILHDAHGFVLLHPLTLHLPNDNTKFEYDLERVAHELAYSLLACTKETSGENVIEDGRMGLGEFEYVCEA